MRGKSANYDPNDEGTDRLNNSVSSVTTSSAKCPSSSTSQVIKGKETWEKWFPMEWIAWLQYGPPSPDPSSHWVSENISEGPKSFSEKRKPAGRVDQRKKEVDIKTITKTKTDTNSLLSINSILAQNELAISTRQDDLMQLNLIVKFAKTPSEVVSNSMRIIIFTEYMYLTLYLVFSSKFYFNMLCLFFQT